MSVKMKSGPHLAVIRSWIQWNALNGSTVIWGSHEVLRLRAVTVNDMEVLAQRIADAVLDEKNTNDRGTITGRLPS